MARRSRSARSVAARDLADIEGFFREVQTRLLTPASTSSRRRSRKAHEEPIPDMISAALAAFADRFRDQVQDKARSVGEDAARYGVDGFRKLQSRVGYGPLVILAVAAGIGFFAGLFGRRD